MSGRLYAFVLGNHKLMALTGAEGELSLLATHDLAREGELEVPMSQAVVDLGEDPVERPVDRRRLVPVRLVSHYGAPHRAWSMVECNVSWIPVR